MTALILMCGFAVGFALCYQSMHEHIRLEGRCAADTAAELINGTADDAVDDDAEVFEL